MNRHPRTIISTDTQKALPSAPDHLRPGINIPRALCRNDDLLTRAADLHLSQYNLLLAPASDTGHYVSCLDDSLLVPIIACACLWGIGGGGDSGIIAATAVVFVVEVGTVEDGVVKTFVYLVVDVTEPVGRVRFSMVRGSHRLYLESRVREGLTIVMPSGGTMSIEMKKIVQRA